MLQRGIAAVNVLHLLGRGEPLTGKAAVDAAVTRIVAAESRGAVDSKNKRSSAAGPAQFLDDTWLELIRATRPDLVKGRTRDELLALRSKPYAQQDLDQLKAYAAEQGCAQLQSWDSGYYGEKLREARYSVSQEALRAYFPVDKVLSGLFAIVQKLYGIQIRELHDFERWHPDVRLFEIEENGQHVGRFYFDLYARADHQFTSRYHRSVSAGASGYTPDSYAAEATNTTNLRLGVAWDRIDLSAFVNNLFDTDDRILEQTGRTGCTNAACASFNTRNYLNIYNTLRPRSVGLTATYRY